MKLATALHSLGLTGPVLDFSKSVIIVDTYVEKETPIAKSRLLANIGPDGIKSHGALVWSSSTHPRRIHLIPCCALSTGGLSDHQPKHSESQLSVFSDPDSALVFKLLIEDFVSGDDPTLRGLIDAYVSVEANDPADPKSEWPCRPRRAWRAQVHHQRHRIQRSLGGTNAALCNFTPNPS
jgi:hypothetical protein